MCRLRCTHRVLDRRDQGQRSLWAGSVTISPPVLGARAGFVTEAFRAGADAHAIMRQTGQQSPGMLEVYARENAPLMCSAVTRIGL